MLNGIESKFEASIRRAADNNLTRDSKVVEAKRERSKRIKELLDHESRNLVRDTYEPLNRSDSSTAKITRVGSRGKNGSISNKKLGKRGVLWPTSITKSIIASPNAASKASLKGKGAAKSAHSSGGYKKAASTVPYDNRNRAVAVTKKGSGKMSVMSGAKKKFVSFLDDAGRVATKAIKLR